MRRSSISPLSISVPRRAWCDRSDLGDLLWLFAAGLGPGEAFRDPDFPAEPNEAFRAIAERHAPGRRRAPNQIVAAARAEFPQFSDLIDAMCR